MTELGIQSYSSWCNGEKGNKAAMEGHLRERGGDRIAEKQESREGLSREKEKEGFL